MKIIKNCYEDLGMFDTNSGLTFLSDRNLIIPVANIQVGEDFELNDFNKIAFVDYSYLAFKNVKKLHKEVYFNRGKFKQNHITNTLPATIKTSIFEIELVDFLNNHCQYWWEVEAEDCYLMIPSYGKICEKFLPTVKLNPAHFFQLEEAAFNFFEE